MEVNLNLKRHSTLRFAFRKILDGNVGICLEGEPSEDCLEILNTPGEMGWVLG